MPGSGLNQPSSDIEPIVGIQFGIFSPEEIERRSVVEITNAGTFDGNEPRIGGLFDPRMGVLDNGKTCRSCGQTNHNCPGHFGHYKLARPVYFIQFFQQILNVLDCVCIRCSKLLIDKNVHKSLLKKRGEVRWKAVLALCKNITRCGQDIEDGCGALQPDRFIREAISRIVAEWDTITTTEGAGKSTEKQRQILECEYVLRLFRRITDEDVDFMGLNRYWCRPDWMICSVMPIPPPQVRPSVIQDNNQRSEDDLTHKLFEIIQTNNALQDKINNNANKAIIDDQYAVLQYHVATLVDNQIPGVAPSAQRSGRPLKSIQQRLGSKEGRIRYNIMGKRVEFSGRSVITPDPNISIEEIGVPIKIAMNLTVPERVTKYNRSTMYKLIQNGADNYPGAKTIVRKDGRTISLKHVNTREIVLNLGDIVNRHLMDGDPILFNRQPTLHRMSMMGHKVKVLPYNTFRLNVSVTAPYNADFDGDEMNAHVPQSYEASIELAQIAAVPKQIITPRHAKPVIGIVQDTCIGSYRLTQPNVQLNRREFMNMMMWNKHFTGKLPDPIKTGKVERYNGQHVLSQIVPPINMEMGNSRYNDEKIPDNLVKIKEGIVSQGIFDKDIFSKPSKGIIHTIFKDYGPEETVHFLDCMQSTVAQFLIYNGFSVGISDLIADERTKRNMDDKIRAKKAEVENIILQLHLDLFTNNTGKSNKEEFENRVFTALNKATDEAGKIGLGSLAAENRLVSMVRAGSKGSLINIAQMLACVGQQAPEGRRIPLGFTDRTLPHYKKYDDSAEARGFVESSFIRGLSPQEFFFHAMSGREGLIDTAVKTADTGYIQRQLVKALEDCVTQNDGSVRDTKMNIVQFHYGEDGTNATMLESQSLGLGKLSEEEIKKEYGMVGVDLVKILEENVEMPNPETLLNEYVAQVLKDQYMMIESVNKFKDVHNSTAVYSPVNIDRLMTNIKVKFRLSTDDKTDLTPDYVIEGIKKVINKTQSYNAIWCALLRFYLAPHKLIYKERFNKKAFDTLCELLIVKNFQSWAQPGEQVGIIAAQSIGEPSTQMTLNTFHLAGVASKSNVTRGVPRLKELLKVTKNPKAISLTVPLKKEYRDSIDKAREVAQDLELTILKDIVTKTAIYFDPSDANTVLEEDKDLIHFYSIFEQDKIQDADKWSKWLMRMEFDRDTMFAKNISMDDVAFALEQKFSEEVHLIYSDYNSDRLVMRIRLTQDQKESTKDDILNLKKLQNKLLTSIVIRGVSGIKSVSYRQEKNYYELRDGKYEAIDQYILDTDGSNFLDIMNHPYVNGNGVMSSHVHDIYENLGIEAARATLLNEITNLFADAGGVDFRHLGLLCDWMTRVGKLLSVDRYGINKQDIGPLAKASFEETEKILLKAALYGEIDPITGVSANIMTGQPIKGGTGFSEILLDENALIRLQDGLPPIEEGDEEDEEYEPTQENIDEALYETAEDKCAAINLKLNVTLPQESTYIEEPDIDMYTIDEED
jgi:DNA-directed RNA polymerase II subunit RPB1